MPNLSPMRVFDFNDVRLLPKKCIVDSRSQVDTKVKFGPKTFNLPVVPANMSTIIGQKLANWSAENDYFYVMHRFDVDPVVFTESMHSKSLYSSISLGIKDIDVENIKRLAEMNKNPEYITIDVAHGHSERVEFIVKQVRQYLPESFVIAGNVGTVEGALSLEDAGAHSIKVGIGPGMACLTSPNTGFGTRDFQLSMIDAVSERASASIIADGGIREYGDIAKSVAFGADMVMIGGMLAGHDENPGDIVDEPDGTLKKAFFGSASEHQKGENKHVEGKKLFLPYKGSIVNTLTTIKENLQSSISYAGGDKLMDLRNVEYVIL